MIESLESKINDLICLVGTMYANSALTSQIEQLSRALLHLRQAEYWRRAAEIEDIPNEDS